MRYRTATSQLVLIASVLFAIPILARGEPVENLLLNGSAEQGKNAVPSIWFAASVPADGLRMWQDHEHVHSGKGCLAISSQHEYEQKVSNNWAQTLQEVPVGKEIQLFAEIRTENVDSANVCVQCWSASGEMLAFATTPPVVGDSDWTTLKSEPIVVPAKTKSIIVRAALTGKGVVYFDDLTLKVVGPSSSESHENDAAAVCSDDSKQSSAQDLKALVSGRIVQTLPINKDGMVLSYLPDWNHGEVDNIAVANNDGGVRTLLAWKGPSQQDISRSDLKFMLAIYSRETTFHAPTPKIQVHEISAKWPEATSWKNQPTFAAEPTATFEMVDGKGWKVFDVTSYVRQQSKEKRPNFGILLKCDNEQRSGEKRDWSGYAFVSHEGLGEWKERRPVLLIVDTPISAQTDESP